MAAHEPRRNVYTPIESFGNDGDAGELARHLEACLSIGTVDCVVRDFYALQSGADLQDALGAAFAHFLDAGLVRTMPDLSQEPLALRDESVSKEAVMLRGGFVNYWINTLDDARRYLGTPLSLDERLLPKHSSGAAWDRWEACNTEDRNGLYANFAITPEGHDSLLHAFAWTLEPKSPVRLPGGLKVDAKKRILYGTGQERHHNPIAKGLRSMYDRVSRFLRSRR